MGLAVLVITLAVGCSSDPAEPEEPVGAAADGRGPSADDVVWQVTSGTGDYSPAALAAEVPELTVYADGRAFIATDGDGGPGGVTQLRAGTVDPDELDDLVARAVDAGAFAHGADYGAADRFDLPLTAVVVADGTIPLTAAVTGLGDDDLDLEPTQADLRDELQALIDDSLALVVDAEPWTPDRLRAVSIGPDAEPEIDAAGAQPWPGPAFAEFPTPDEFSGTACLLVGEPEAVDVWSAALDNPGATWVEEDELRQIVVAPVLPGEEGCPHGPDDDHDDGDHSDEPQPGGD